MSHYGFPCRKCCSYMICTPCQICSTPSCCVSVNQPQQQQQLQQQLQQQQQQQQQLQQENTSCLQKNYKDLQEKYAKLCSKINECISNGNPNYKSMSEEDKEAFNSVIMPLINNKKTGCGNEGCKNETSNYEELIGRIINGEIVFEKNRVNKYADCEAEAEEEQEEVGAANLNTLETMTDDEFCCCIKQQMNGLSTNKKMLLRGFLAGYMFKSVKAVKENNTTFIANNNNLNTNNACNKNNKKITIENRDVFILKLPRDYGVNGSARRTTVNEEIPSINNKIEALPLTKQNNNVERGSSVAQIFENMTASVKEDQGEAEEEQQQQQQEQQEKEQGQVEESVELKEEADEAKDMVPRSFSGLKNFSFSSQRSNRSKKNEKSAF